MHVHDQLMNDRHEEPARAAGHGRRARDSRRWRVAVPSPGAHTGRAHGWLTQTLRFWATSRPAGVPAGLWHGPSRPRFPVIPGPQPGFAAHAGALRLALGVFLAGPAGTREHERRRLRRELHDGLGPTLAGLTLGLDTAQALSAGQPGLHELLGRLKAETQGAATDLRRIVYGLPPPALGETGLAGSLREQLERLRCEAPTLAIGLVVPGTGLAGLPAAVEVACYRIVTEALANVIRHAHATRCVVRIRTDHGIRVEVRDNGTGLPPGWRAGVGITSMRERVTGLGGELAIGPSRPHGTRITAWLPVQEQR